ncbi:MAG: hypothetical protein RID09_00450 [Coleofasciculus sp. G1-WW12-02]|uniref:hypothetical protein n=1 Tax=Coleofasciculus sp. G1-WW12-02 TaxID=3068483 RepID=UPI0032F49922
MNTQNEARKLATQERLADEQLKQNMLNRAEEEVEAPSADSPTQQQTRESATQQREKDEHLQQTMHSRAQENTPSGS